MTTFKRAGLTTMVLAVAVLTSAHLGSPDTWFQGQAGSYPVQVVIRLPGVVPGLGQIDISVTGTGVEQVTARPVVFNAGTDGAPPPDIAKPVPGRPGSYHAELWFMTQASFSVHVTVTGDQGTGTVIVPVVAVAERQIALYPWLGKLLLALGAFLFIGAVTIVRAAATDAVTEPGATPSGRRVAGIVAPVLGAGILGLALWGGWAWWQAVERKYRDGLYRSFEATARVDTSGGWRMLEFAITDSTWSAQRIGNRIVVSPLVPDHGKLMHLFLVGQATDDGNAGFAHLHPVSTDSITFVTNLGVLPAGRYDVYADVVHESGFPQTLVATVDVPGPTPGDSVGLLDPDDTVGAGRPTGGEVVFADSTTVTWVDRPDALAANDEAGLRFTVRGADGSVAALEPYLGMAGHAVVQREDGQVYIHLHPNGTISMAAQSALGARLPTDTVPGMLARRLAADTTAGGHAAMAFDGSLRFPYAFPKPGEYRIWVQFRRGGALYTAPFRISVH